MKNLLQKQKEEGLARLHELGVCHNVIVEFEKDEHINYSERQNNLFSSTLYWIDNHDEYLQCVKDFESKSKAKVYMGQLLHITNTNWDGTVTSCDQLSLLFVSNYPELWDKERENLRADHPFSQVITFENDGTGKWRVKCKEIQKILVHPDKGGILRTLPTPIVQYHKYFIGDPSFCLEDNLYNIWANQMHFQGYSSLSGVSESAPECFTNRFAVQDINDDEGNFQMVNAVVKANYRGGRVQNSISTLPVDSGCIGIVNEELWKPNFEAENAIHQYGIIVKVIGGPDEHLQTCIRNKKDGTIQCNIQYYGGTEFLVSVIVDITGEKENAPHLTAEEANLMDRILTHSGLEANWHIDYSGNIWDIENPSGKALSPQEGLRQIADGMIQENLQEFTDEEKQTLQNMFDRFETDIKLTELV